MGSLLIAFVNKIIEGVGAAINIFLALLPNSPFTWDLSGVDSNVLKVLLWLIPVQAIVTMLQTYVSAVAGYYIVRSALRWFKVAGQ